MDNHFCGTGENLYVSMLPSRFFKREYPAMTSKTHTSTPDRKRPYSSQLLASVIFSSRWLQMPLYLGLILVQIVYVYKFLVELQHLLAVATKISETEIMLIALALIDLVMISNLIVMVIIGGYETFVSRLRMNDHPDSPEWLSHVNANTMKIKLSLALISITSVQLLKSFINAEHLTDRVLR